MAIISFWNNGKEETGKSSSIVAITTFLSIQHNYKTLVLDTKYNNYSYQDCYWQEEKTSKLINARGLNIGYGIGGLSKAILSNKTSPEIITNYTRIVFKDRLELLTDPNISTTDYETSKRIFKDIAKIASKYYDLVFIDIDSDLEENIKESLIEVSDLVVANLQQKLRSINEYLKIKEENPILRDKPIMPILSRYDKNSKYNTKNVARYIREKRGVYSIPYNTLFFEACSEGKVADFFIKFRKISPKDKNFIFISEVEKTTEQIMARLKELQMRM